MSIWLVLILFVLIVMLDIFKSVEIGRLEKRIAALEEPAPDNKSKDFAMAQLREIAGDLSMAPDIRARVAVKILEWS